MNSIKRSSEHDGERPQRFRLHRHAALRRRQSNSRTTLGYGTDWPIDWREMWWYYDRIEDAEDISWIENDKASIRHGSKEMKQMLRSAGVINVFEQPDDTNRDDVTPQTTIQALGLRTADRIEALARRGEL